MNIVLALVVGIIYWLATNKIWYGTQHIVRQPLFLAVPLGLIMGDVETAMKIGAALQLIYLGAIAPGGNLPADEALAACITIPVAIEAGIDPSMAVTIAMPIGLLGVLLDNLRKTYASVWVRMADKAAKEGDMKKARLAQFWYPLIVSIPLRVIPTTAALLVGTTAVAAFLNSIPAWAINGLSVAGGILPALGFAVTIQVIGKKSLIPYFLLGFIIFTYAGINIISIALIGVCLAIIQSKFAQTDDLPNVQQSEGDLL
ncbi:D-glucosaminate-specific PTS system IIC component [Breznakia blatticola]|uniref:D-glucosaminate-specific PTS system IIC component n=1 Tax=Breznakia blatticola TaxID=1754012 RepID=A0A4R7Z8D7_9FIRM|nr:PTS sugar transporter subunit IIC [Breznakia blatticola]TDW09369.1 D-glucosaminate-specific PTS system IIC component [Breznakia blatticola]